MAPTAAPGRWPLRRLVAVWAALVALSLAAAFVLQARQQASSEAWHRALATAASEAARISVVAERLVTVDPSVVNEVLVHAVLQDGVELALVTDPQGRIVVSTRAADRGRLLAEAHGALHAVAPRSDTGDPLLMFEDRQAGLLRVMRPLPWPAAPGELRRTSRGALWLQVDVAREVQRRQRQIMQAQTAEGLVLLLGGLLLLLGLDQWLLRPLARLREAARRLGEGQEAALPPSRVLELDSLGRALLRAGSDLQRTLQRLRESEQGFRALAESAPDAIVTLDAEGRVDQFNQAAERLFGYSAEEMLGQPLTPLLPLGVAAEHAQHVREFGNELEGTARRMKAGRLVLGRHRDGHTLHLEVGISRSRLGDAMQFTAMLRDVSDRVAIEAELESHRRSLEDLVRRRTAELVLERDRSQAATRAKNEFLARIGHELRTPMNTVLGMAHLLRQELDGPAAARVAALDSAARQLHGLLEDILDFTRLEAGQLALVPALNALRPMLAAVLQGLAPARLRSEAELVLWVDAEVPAQVLVDGLRLRQVLGHLLDNALKFTPAGHVTLRITRMAGALPGTADLRFEVSDSGIGMPAELVDRLFEPFEQGDVGDSRAFGGAGLGLVICQRLLALMGAGLVAQSQPGKGSRFGFTLRCPLPADEASVPGPAEAAEPGLGLSAVASGAGHALVVDALPEARAAQAEALRALGFVTDTADDAVAALRMLRAAAQRGEPVDWVLVGARQATAGLSMPSDAHAQGLEPAPRWLLALPPTAAPPLADALRAGFVGLLDKPVLLDDLAERLRAEPQPMPAPVAPAPAPRAAPNAPATPVGGPGNVSAEALQPLASVSGLDIECGLRSVRGDGAAYGRLLRSFAGFHRPDGERLRQAVQAGDLGTLRELAHSLKSASGSIGALRVQALAQALARHPGPIDGGARALAGELAGELQSLIGQIELRLATSPGPAVSAAGGPGPATDPAARQRRLVLREHLQRRDMAALRWLQTASDDELVAMGLTAAALRAAVQAFDYDSALRLLSAADAAQDA